MRISIAGEGRASLAARAIGKDIKDSGSNVLCAVAIPLAFFVSWGPLLLYAAVALIRLIPDRRIGKRIAPQRRDGARGCQAVQRRVTVGGVLYAYGFDRAPAG